MLKSAFTLAIVGICTAWITRPVAAQVNLSPAEVREISEEAFIYGFPLVMNYGVMYESFVDTASSQYRCPFNSLHNTARVFTPQDTAVVTPNSDTPYSFFCADLRAEPMVFTVPPIEEGRYFSVQLVDWYTFNVGYAGTRTTGNGGGNFLIVGPDWNGETPPGIAKVYRCETEFVFAIFRTQLFNPEDLPNVIKIQAGYRLQPLSSFLKQTPPAASPAISWPKIDKELAATNPFNYLSFVLQFCPPVGPASVEQPMRARFAKLGIQPGKPFDATKLSSEQLEALKAGIKSGLAKITEGRALFGKEVNGWRVATSGIGDRSVYLGDWKFRAVVAMAGIYANNPAEAIYPLLAKDSDGQQPDCSKHNYTLTFTADQMPPVDAFWSVTMYDAKTQLLVENPISRYLINAPMLPGMKKNDDGSLTIYIQAESPGKDKESNWLPAPHGPIYVAMRLYAPKEEAVSGSWQPPVVKAVAKTP